MRDRATLIAQQFVLASGRYLRNTVRSEHTCAVCTSPVYEAPLCDPCAEAGDEVDLVAPLVYAVGGEQSARILRGYKDARDWNTRARHSRTLAQLLYLGVEWHQRCLEQEMPISLRVAVPSARGFHPFQEIAHDLGIVDPRVRLRQTAAHAYALEPETDLAGQHVLVLDDMWTRGLSARAAAATLRAAGATRVSAMTAGRWVNPEYGDNVGFLARWASGQYDPRLCPVTGTRCR